MTHPSHPAGEVRFGIHAGQQHTTFEAYLGLWRAVEDLGFDWASVFDHFLPIQSNPEGPCFDGLTLLSALAAHTRTIRCGVIVVGVTYRHPAVLANIASTVDHVSGGRLELGMGAAWYEMEHDEYGIPFPPIGRRISMLGEALKVVRALWTQHRANFKGRHFVLEEALCEPKPVQSPHPPLWVGGAGEKRTLRVVAESADGWNTFFMPEEAYKHKLNVLAEHGRAVGRDTDQIRKQLVVQAVVAESESDLQRRLQALANTRGVDPERLRAAGLVGTPEQCVEKLLPYVRLGVGDFLIGARPPADLETLELIAKRVAPAVKAEAKSILAR
jgi:F420-dependent oxidoreductase-like protein